MSTVSLRCEPLPLSDRSHGMAVLDSVAGVDASAVSYRLMLTCCACDIESCA